MTRDEKTQRKEKVLHTRVSERLEDELKQKAQELGVSVSNLVRNVLQNAFDLAHDIVDDAAEVARVAGSSGRDRQAGTVLGWQELVLNVNAVCAQCNAVLRKGESAAVAITGTGAARNFLCTQCLQAVSHE